MVVVCHYIATIAWLANANAEFKSDCDWDGNQTDVPTVCAKDGPSIAIFLMVFLPILVIVFIFVFQLAYKDLMAARADNQGQLVAQQGGYIPPPPPMMPAPAFYQAYQPAPIIGQGYPVPNQQFAPPPQYPNYPPQYQQFQQPLPQGPGQA
eukprot:CAMPEP_0202949214 /NCGR_PEP_ID=MMETSP1395-20130829/15220_1 /ASSEMBLY_ACC=CAM_ASM_000871 /TAXON_ID=5961 /ORGANISM="Blepharisma japonicum, Strain Stock R1072" /LENGTH=150 /DNA_ID=CAMNT_0049652047 /DNA_START=420 /DNA_END=872 /DNA_ORIENTATION=+